MAGAWAGQSAQRRGFERSRMVLAGVVGALLALPLGGVLGPPVAAADEVTFAAVADAYVDSSQPTSNFGTRSEVRVDGSPTVNAYLRFDISSVASAGAARLRLYVRSQAGQGIQVRPVASQDWGESTITWSNAPAYGSVAASTGRVPAGTWVEVDVSSLVTTAGLVSFAITNPGSTAVAIRSRESAEAPQLIVGTTGGTNANPVAAFSASCTSLSCSFDASASLDADGSIVSYAWQFGTDGAGSGVTTSHTFPAPGDQAIVLTVTDNSGGTGSVTHTVHLTAPSTTHSFVVSRNGASYVAASSDRTFTGSLKGVVESAVAQLQAAGGGTVSFDAGDFDLGSDYFKFSDIVEITFQGAGMGQTIIHNNTSAAADTEPFNFSGADHVVVRDLTVNAGGAPRTTSDALDFDRGNHVLVERVEVTGSRARGIIFDGKNDSWTADYNTVRDCVITGVPGQGIELLASSHNLVEGCVITNAGRHGIEVGKASTIADQANKQSNDNTIRNNTVDRSGENGIYVNSGSRNTIVGNRVTNSAQAVASRDGIRISASDGIVCDDNVVDGNTATDTQSTKTQAWGLRIASAECHRTVVGGTNVFSGNAAGPVLDQGTGTIFSAPAGDTEAPSIPTGLVVTAPSGCRVQLAWNAAIDNVGVAGYGVYRGGVLIGAVGGSTLAYTDTGVAPGLSYSYAVDAVDASGNRSSRSSPVPITTPSSGCAVTLLPTADSYVEAASPASNNGAKTQVRADGSPYVASYLAFNVPVGGTITSATLRIWVNSNHSAGFDVHVGSGSAWNETGITYANAPGYGGVIGSSGPFSGGTWVEVDVTAAVAAGGPLTLVLTTTSQTAMSLASRESGATAPQLVISAS
jgi:parallel beta-helix repeat protein